MKTTGVTMKTTADGIQGRRVRPMARVALMIAVVSGLSVRLSGAAVAGNLPLHFGSAVPGGGFGPVFTGSTIIPIYWGNWQPGSGGANDPYVIDKYLYYFGRWLGGEGALYGDDPILRQYGVWGANIQSADIMWGLSGSSVTENQVASNILSAYPSTDAGTVFLVLLNGFSSYDWEANNVAGNHTDKSGRIFAEVALNGNNGSDLNNFERSISHEIEEMLTDPEQQIGNFGWVTHQKLFGFYDAEGADQCETRSNPELPHPDEVPLSFGVVQNFTDNSFNTHTTPPADIVGDGSQSGAVCHTWAPGRFPLFGVAKRPGVTQLDLVYQDWSRGGALEHVDFLPNYTWVWETMDYTSPGLMVGPPSVVALSTGQLDAFVRELGGPPGAALPGIAHYTKMPYQPFSTPTYLTGGGGTASVGPPSAASWGGTRMDVFTTGTDNNLVHFWSDDDVNFQHEIFNFRMIGPPAAVSRGSGMLDVLAYGAFGGGLIGISFNSPGHPGWVENALNVTDLYFGDPADMISVAAWNGNSLQTSVAGLFLNFDSSWNRTLELSVGSSATGDPGDTASGSVAASQDGTETTVVWKLCTTSDPNFPAGLCNSYNAVRFVQGHQSGSVQTIVSGNGSAPVVIYGSDGYPEILSVGYDGCLREAYLDYWSGGPVVNGPFATPICGFSVGPNGTKPM